MSTHSPMPQAFRGLWEHRLFPAFSKLQELLSIAFQISFLGLREFPPLYAQVLGQRLSGTPLQMPGTLSTAPTPSAFCPEMSNLLDVPRSQHLCPELSRTSEFCSAAQTSPPGSESGHLWGSPAFLLLSPVLPAF